MMEKDECGLPIIRNLEEVDVTVQKQNNTVLYSQRKRMKELKNIMHDTKSKNSKMIEKIQLEEIPEKEMMMKSFEKLDSEVKDIRRRSVEPFIENEEDNREVKEAPQMRNVKTKVRKKKPIIRKKRRKPNVKRTKKVKKRKTLRAKSNEAFVSWLAQKKKEERSMQKDRKELTCEEENGYRPLTFRLDEFNRSYRRDDFVKRLYYRDIQKKIQKYQELMEPRLDSSKNVLTMGKKPRRRSRYSEIEKHEDMFVKGPRCLVRERRGFGSSTKRFPIVGNKRYDIRVKIVIV